MRHVSVLTELLHVHHQLIVTSTRRVNYEQRGPINYEQRGPVTRANKKPFAYILRKCRGWINLYLANELSYPSAATFIHTFDNFVQ